MLKTSYFLQISQIAYNFLIHADSCSIGENDLTSSSMIKKTKRIQKLCLAQVDGEHIRSAALKMDFL